MKELENRCRRLNYSGLSSAMSPEPVSEPQPADANRIKIHNWPDANPPITDDTVLVRYMRLETFLLLLDGRVFIPTLKQLQSGDINEGQLSFMRAGFYLDMMRAIVVPHKDWLLEAAGNPKFYVLNESNENARELMELALAEQSWRSQLATRRCVWCWDRSNELSYLMWKIYGDRGVAVFSTVGRIRQTLADCGGQGIVSPVRYVSPGESIPRPDYDLLGEHCHRSHLFKDSGYRAEQEVRFVLKVDSRLTNRSPGVTVSLNPKSLVDHQKAWPFVKPSPFLPLEEQMSIQSLAMKRLIPNWSYDPPRTSGSPFAYREDSLPAGLFPDLDFPDSPFLRQKT
jgi:hypothetical protein